MKYIPKNFEIGQTKDVFGFKLEQEYLISKSKIEYFSHTTTLKDELVGIRSYDYFADYSSYVTGEARYYMALIVVSYSEESRILEIREDNKIIYTKNIDDIIKIIHKNNINQQRLDIKEMFYFDDNAYVEVLYMFINIPGTEVLSSKTTIYLLLFYMFINVK